MNIGGCFSVGGEQCADIDQLGNKRQVLRRRHLDRSVDLWDRASLWRASERDHRKSFTLTIEDFCPHENWL